MSGGAAMPALFRHLPGGVAVARVLESVPGPTTAGYGWIARHRIAISRFVPRKLKVRARRRLAERLGALSAG